MAFPNVQSWDETPASNTEIDGVNIDEGCNPSGINNAIRELMSQIAAWTGADTIASATTTDLSTVNGQYVEITGTTTITGLGTVKAGWVKFVKFAGALTLTHNGTSLILPGAANITTAAGDTFLFASEGSGNWRCLAYQRADGLVSFANGSAAAPSVSFASDPDSGMYRVGANQIGLATTGILRVTVDQNGVTTTVPMLPPGTGSAAAPDYSFSNDTDIGMYRSGANQLAFATTGVQRATLDSSALTLGSNVAVAFSGTGAATTKTNLAITAADVTQTANAVGTYGFLCNDETGVGSHGPGGTLAGSSLLFAGLHIDNTAESVTMETSGTVFPSGTWQCMGRMINTGAANEKSATLWVRTV